MNCFEFGVYVRVWKVSVRRGGCVWDGGRVELWSENVGLWGVDVIVSGESNSGVFCGSGRVGLFVCYCGFNEL